MRSRGARGSILLHGADETHGSIRLVDHLAELREIALERLPTRCRRSHRVGRDRPHGSGVAALDQARQIGMAPQMPAERTGLVPLTEVVTNQPPGNEAVD